MAPIRFALAVLTAAALLQPVLAAEKWRMQYFYDKDRSSLVITDLQFPSAARGVAVGYIDEDGKSKPATVTTTDGGARWTVSSLHQVPYSLFYLNETIGWMVTPQAIWRTDEKRGWQELPKSPKLLIGVYFLDEDRGFAVGAKKAAYQTVNGGRTWEPIAAAADPPTSPEYTVYNVIAFADPSHGMISGYGGPPPPVGPSWLNPLSATRRRETLRPSIVLFTADGGRTWKPSTTSTLGHLTRAGFLPGGAMLGLIEFPDGYDWPSEVQREDSAAGNRSVVYHSKERDVTDILPLPSGTLYLAAVEVDGRLHHSPIPRKVKILKSADLDAFEEMEVDYRATAVHAMLRRAPGGALWAATDTGMILKLAP